MSEFYQSTICHVCKIITSNIKRCSGCKLYAYCSKDHQKYHWLYHKEFCKMIQFLLKKDNKNRHHIFDIPKTKNMTNDEWKQMRLDAKILWEYLLQRKLTNEENQVWMFPRVCKVCRLSQQDILFDCSICYSVSYCSADHQNSDLINHNQFCLECKLCYEVNLYLFQNGPKVELASNILNNFDILPKNTDEFIQNCTKLSEVSKNYRILAADVISPFLTIIFALQSCNLLKNRKFIKDKLVIHIVGASLYEMSLPLANLCEFFIQWITNLTNLTLILIGPELTADIDTKKQLSHTYDNKTYMVIFERCLYHDYANCNKSSPVADIVVAFNCGLHEFGASNDTWTKSIGCLIKVAPLIITAYTADEAVRDLEKLKLILGDELEVLVNCQKNPFRGCRPLKDWESNDLPIFYQNNYITICKNI